MVEEFLPLGYDTASVYLNSLPNDAASDCSVSLPRRYSNCVPRNHVVPHTHIFVKYEGGSESKGRFAIQRYLLIIGKKQNMQVLSHTFTYFST